MYLILKEASSKGPDTAEDKVQLVQLLGTVRRRVFRRQVALQKMAEHLDVRDLHNGGNLLEARAEDVQQHGNVLLEENCQVGLLGDHLA